MYGSLLYIGCSRLYIGYSVMRVDMYPERALQETLASTWTPFRALVFRTRFYRNPWRKHTLIRRYRVRDRAL